MARCLDQIPRGHVATCGAIARALGDGRATRAVAAWLTDHPETPEAHRVVRADGSPILTSSRGCLAREGLRIVRGSVDPARILGALQGTGFLGRLRGNQRRLAAKVLERDDAGPIETVAGVDASYRGDEMWAAAVSIRIADLRCVEIAVLRRPVEFPYIPTYLAYRELPAIEAVVRRLSSSPDVLMVDGHGRLHPSLFGVACHAGVVLDMPTIGIAKHALAGRMRAKSRRDRETIPLWIDDIVRGEAWVPPGRSRPIYVSIGHRISLRSAVDITRRTTRRGYPEALRIADRASREMKGK